MVNTMKNSPKQKIEKFSFYTSLVLVTLLATYNFSNYIYLYLNIDNLNTDSLKSCSFMLFTPNLISNVANYEISSFVKDIYVIPEFENIRCFSQLFGSFSSVSQVFRCFWTCSDLFGCTRTCSDASGCIRTNSEFFESLEHF
mgnify:CR=1 FL=1